MNPARIPAPGRPPRRRATGAALLVLLFTSALPARAEDPAPGGAEPTFARGQRAFGLGPTLGFWSGLGVLAGGGGETVKAWVSGGYAPVLVFSNARTPDRAVRFDYYGAYQLGGDLTVRVMERPRSELGLMLGYKFNSVLGHGGGAGVRVRFDVSERLGLDLSAGLAVFPAAKGRLDDRGYPADRDPPLSPALQGGASVGLLVYP